MDCASDSHIMHYACGDVGRIASRHGAGTITGNGIDHYQETPGIFDFHRSASVGKARAECLTEPPSILVPIVNFNILRFYFSLEGITCDEKTSNFVSGRQSRRPHCVPAGPGGPWV
jgi:hypothetical protein